MINLRTTSAALGAVLGITALAHADSVDPGSVTPGTIGSIAQDPSLSDPSAPPPPSASPTAALSPSDGAASAPATDPFSLTPPNVDTPAGASSGTDPAGAGGTPAPGAPASITSLSTGLPPNSPFPPPDPGQGPNSSLTPGADAPQAVPLPLAAHVAIPMVTVGAIVGIIKRRRLRRLDLSL